MSNEYKGEGGSKVRRAINGKFTAMRRFLIHGAISCRREFRFPMVRVLARTDRKEINPLN